ncbi:MAG: bifunctional phosphoglucose/phosphomannose isomerase [Anaerolineales bacterium]
MNLDDLEKFESIDSHGMLADIDGLPDQLLAAWNRGQEWDLPDASDVDRVVVAGMGGSAIGADLLSAYVAPIARVPVIVWRNYDLPAYVQGPDTLVIGSSHSGNTEETLSAFQQGIERGANLMAVTTGGALADLADEHGAGLWTFRHDGQPRAGVGYSFGLLLALLSRLGLIETQEAAVKDAVEEMKSQRKKLNAEVPVTQNPAKRMAGQLIDRWPTIIGAEFLAPVARRWRTQISELAKAVAQFEELPEADHNMVAGVEAPESAFGQTMVVLLSAQGLDPRNVERTRITRELLMVEGFNTDMVEAVGETRLAQQWTALHYGDYVSYYLAMAYEIDPTPVHAIEELKRRLKEE